MSSQRFFVLAVSGAMVACSSDVPRVGADVSAATGVVPDQACVSIASPGAGATIDGSAVAVKTADSCSGVWFESLFVDGSHVADFPPGAVVVDASSLSPGSHTLEVTSQSENPGSVTLGKDSVVVNVSCISIASPGSGATIGGAAVPVQTKDSCANAWFESLFVDGAHVADFPPGTVVVDTTSLAAGSHTLEVTSQSQNPGSATLGTASVTVTAAPTGSAQDSTTLPPGATLPTEAECAAWVAQQGSDPEHAPWNTGSSDGFNYNVPPSGGTPSYFYDYAGGEFSPRPQMARVDGNQSGTTDDLVRIFSCKYGIAANFTRSQMTNESFWHEDCPALTIPGVKTGSGTACNGGDLNSPPGDPGGLPVTAVTPGGVFSALDGAGGLSGSNHYDSWGIEQDKVYYDWMYWPMIAISTPWALDVRAAELRSCIDGDQESFYASNGSNVTDYKNAVANAQANPNGPIPAGMACLQVDFHGQPQTNINCVTIGCFGTHYSGGWFADSVELDYDSNGFGHMAARDWPGGETN